MKSKSDRRFPKFPALPVSGPPVQTNPNVWAPKLHGFPYWFNAAGWFGTAFVTPFMSTAALKEWVASAPLSAPPRCIEPAQWEIVEIRARANPWHPSGRLEKLVLKKWTAGDPASKTFTHLTLKFHGDGEQIECVSAYRTTEFKAAPAPAKVHVFSPKYKGPRQANDTKSAVSGNKRKPS